MDNGVRLTLKRDNHNNDDNVIRLINHSNVGVNSLINPLRPQSAVMYMEGRSYKVPKIGKSLKYSRK